MKKSLITILITTVCFVKCYSPSEIIKDDFYTNCGYRGDVNSNSNIIDSDHKSILSIMSLKFNYMDPQNNLFSQDPLAINNYYNRFGYYKRGKNIKDILGTVISREREYWIAPNGKFFGNTDIPKGCKYIIGAVVICRIIDNLILMDDG